MTFVMFLVLHTGMYIYYEVYVTLNGVTMPYRECCEQICTCTQLVFPLPVAMLYTSGRSYFRNIIQQTLTDLFDIILRAQYKVWLV